MRRSFVPPVRDEEHEIQRKAHAKRVRETRRSTQVSGPRPFKGTVSRDFRFFKKLSHETVRSFFACMNGSHLTKNPLMAYFYYLQLMPKGCGVTIFATYFFTVYSW